MDMVIKLHFIGMSGFLKLSDQCLKTLHSEPWADEGTETFKSSIDFFFHFLHEKFFLPTL